MNQAEAANFATALNAIAGYVPPLLFAQVINQPACRMIEQVANGQMIVAIVPKPPAKPTLVEPPSGEAQDERGNAGGA